MTIGKIIKDLKVLLHHGTVLSVKPGSCLNVNQPKYRLPPSLFIGYAYVGFQKFRLTTLTEIDTIHSAQDSYGKS